MMILGNKIYNINYFINYYLLSEGNEGIIEKK